MMENSKLKLFVKKLGAFPISPPKDIVGLRERAFKSPCYSLGQFIIVFVFSSDIKETQEVNAVRFYFKGEILFWVSCNSIKFFEKLHSSFEDYNQVLNILNYVKKYLI